MEAKVLSGGSFTQPGQASRMVKDLSICSQNFICNWKERLAAKAKDHEAATGRRHQQLHVGIVGAGLAGLRCAEVLAEADIRVTLIEARDRLGGRVCQCNLQGQPVDMGPNWIYGTYENPMIQLAQDTDSKLCSPGEDTRVYDSNGMPMNDERALDGSTTLWRILGDAFKKSNENCSTIEPNITLKDYLKERLLASTFDEGLQHDVLELAETWGAYNGDPFEQQSLKWVWLEECLDGENRFVSSTHQKIIERVSEAVVSHADIHLSTRVQAIVSQEMEKGDKKVIVKTTNGSFGFDEVVVTVPLGCLKMDTLQFHPSLPRNVSQAITDASYGRLEKVFVAFAAPFWERSDTDASKGGDTYPMFTHFLRPTYALEEQRSWTLEMLALSSTALFGAHAQPLLVFHLWGAAAARVTSAIAGLTPSSDEYYNVIDTLFRPFYSRLPNYKEDCVPTAVLTTNWQNDELAGNGSYTNFTTHYRGGPLKGDPAIDDGVRAMRHGLPERGLWFAGEHTAPFVALGTSTGAYWSGEAVATRIMERYTLSSQLHSY